MNRILILLIITAAATLNNSYCSIPDSFARRCGTEFCMGGSAFYFAGANTYDFFTYGDGAEYTDSTNIEKQFIDKARIDQHMGQLAQDKVKVIRLWMFSHEKWHGFEPLKGQYNESQFRLFDYVLESARKHGIYLIPVLENYWEAYGGIDSRLSWEGLPAGQSGRWRFFNRGECPGCFESFQKYISYALNRSNHYSGLKYKDDPVIFAWDLMNEPRYQNATPNENTTGVTLRAWVDTMAAFIKSIDRNHMVCAGIEGHESRYGFGGDEGNPFIHIQRFSYIDFTSAHPYPTEGWAGLTIDQTVQLVRQWITESHDSIGKPFFLGEFNVHDGHNGTTRSQAIYDEMENSGGNGSAFWWYSDKTYDPNFGVWKGKPELEVFRKHSLNMQNKSIPVALHSPPISHKPSTVNQSAVLLFNKRISGERGAVLYTIYGRRFRSDHANYSPGVYIVPLKE